MSIPPWESDRVLTATMAAALIQTQFPDIDASTVEYLGSGWEFDVYVTRDEWAFRFPRRRECEQLFDSEQAVLALVATALPAGVAVPHVERWGEPAHGFPYRFAGHRLIGGETAHAVDPSHLPLLARDIATFLGALHSVPEEAGRAAGLRESDLNDVEGAEWVELGFEAAFKLRGLDPAVDRGLRWLQHVHVPVTPPPFDGLRLIHQDLGPEHLIVNRNGRLVGVLDWTDTMLGDTARDFVFLVTWQGWTFADQLLQHYPVEVDSTFGDRLRFMSQLLSLLWLATASRQDANLAEWIEGVRNVFASEML